MWLQHPKSRDIVANAWNLSVYGNPMHKSLFSHVVPIADCSEFLKVIPKSITPSDNMRLAILPTMEEVKNAVFSLSPNSSIGPDGFPRSFFQHFWDIIRMDVYNFVLQFFQQGMIIPNYNSSHVILIPKESGTDEIGNFHPIVVSNFKYKIISKVLSDRLSSVIDKVVSSHQRGFISDRSITDCIALTSEAINLLDKNIYFGNTALKIDIRKAFDKLDWSFLINVSKAFGFCDVFCHWISALLRSDELSILVNGQPIGFFSCCRGVRWATPNLLCFFVLLRRFLAGPCRVPFPIHVLYTNDIKILCKCSLQNLSLLPIVDRIKSKLAMWKGVLLSYMGCVLLVKFVLQNMLIHNFQVYKWPLSLLKLIESWFRNFIWSGPIYQSKLTTVHWHIVCSNFDEGGLGVRSLMDINNAYMLKLCWNFVKKDSNWASMLASKVYKRSGDVIYYLASTIWASIRDMYSIVKDNSTWKIGIGKKVNFWIDRWLSMLIIDILNIDVSLHPKLTSIVDCFIRNGSWHLPPFLQNKIGDQVSSIVLPTFECEDSLKWSFSSNGSLSFKEAFSFIKRPKPKLNWAKQVWKFFVLWRLQHDKLPFEDLLRRKGVFITSVCSHYYNAYETTTHLFFECPFALSL
uniref:Ribonuclease H protein At1g65750 family n=1 Tax=Cajanus cajan TaxID=3821 RepID=A0A151TIY7_CAJCA|nr:Putative ribonuclease H protein At1g65750 family [Cajanus cajan]